MAGRRFTRIFRLVVREPSVESEVDAEIGAHLDQVTEWLVARGWKPDAAREEARRRFGNLDEVRRALRVMDTGAGRRRRLGERFDTLRLDFTLAWRGLRRSPGYAVVVIGTLGLALGANATMFGVVDRLLLAAPPGIVEPDRIRRIDAARWINGALSEEWDAVSYPSFVGVRDHGRSFSHVAAVTTSELSFGLGREARAVEAVFGSGQYFGLLGATPRLGRFFGEPEDVPPTGSLVAVASYRFWRDGLGGDRDAIGRRILLNGKPFEIIGVAEPGFTGTSLEAVDLWVPLSTSGMLLHGGDAWVDAHNWQWLNMLVRLEPGVTDERGEAEATRGYRLGNATAGDFEAKAVVGFRTLQEQTDGIGQERIAGWLYGVTLVVLVIACANIANVVLARGVARRSEAAVMQALGISRTQMFRQIAVETLLLTGLSLALGLVLTRWGGLLIRRLLLEGTVFDSDPVNLRVFLATAAAATAAAALAGFWPLLRSARVDPATQLHGAGRSTGSRGSRRSRGILLLAQTSLCTGLVVLAGLFVKSIESARNLDLGIAPGNVSLVSVELGSVGLDARQTTAFYYRAAERLRRLPGVTAAGVSYGAPFRSNSGRRLRIPGRDSIPQLQGGGPYYFAVGEGTLQAYGIRLLEGRDFTAADRAGSEPVIIVSRRTATTLWPTGSALGQCVFVGADSLPCRRIVGVVSDIHREGLDEAPFFLYFTVLGQESPTLLPGYLVVRTRPDDPDPSAAIREALLDERAELPYIQIVPYQSILERHRRPWTLGASLLTVFGALSLVIASIGLYGVIGFGVSQRTRELGLRAALGAGPARLIGSVVAGGMATALAGIASGVGLALLATPTIRPLLFRTDPADPAVLLVATALVAAVSLAAAWLPGRRALRIDPIEALRADG